MAFLINSYFFLWEDCINGLGLACVVLDEIEMLLFKVGHANGEIFAKARY